MTFEEGNSLHSGCRLLQVETKLESGATSCELVPRIFPIPNRRGLNSRSIRTALHKLSKRGNAKFRRLRTAVQKIYERPISCARTLLPRSTEESNARSSRRTRTILGFVGDRPPPCTWCRDRCVSEEEEKSTPKGPKSKLRGKECDSTLRRWRRGCGGDLLPCRLSAARPWRRRRQETGSKR